MPLVFVDLAKYLWDPVSGLSLQDVTLILLPALVFDFALGFVMRVIGVASHRLYAGRRQRRRDSRLLALKNEIVGEIFQRHPGRAGAPRPGHLLVHQKGGIGKYRRNAGLQKDKAQPEDELT